MTRTKKIGVATVSVLCAAAVITTSGIALFSDTDTSDSNATAGGVSIAPVELTVGNAAITKTTESEFISTYAYCGSSSVDEPSDSGPWAEQGIGYTPRWKYTTVANQMLEPTYFRTSDGEVAYCMDLGKDGPSSGAANEETSVSDAANRVLAAGYPTKTADDYQTNYPGLTDIELEWATQVALKIVEGTAYVKDTNGNMVESSSLAITLDQFSLDDDTYRFNPTWSSTTRKAQAENILNLVKDLVAIGNDTSTSVDRFEMNTDNATTQKVSGGYLVGPYEVTSTYTDAVTLTADSASVEFRDSNGNTITSITGDGEFYVFIPDSETNEVTITAEIDGKTMPASYYYWTGEDDEQKMLVSKTVPCEYSSTITTTYDDSLTNWNPGDIATILWNVKNTNNKSIDTRNTVYLYWDNDDIDIEDNPVYLYTEETANLAIAQDIKDGNPSKNIDLGDVVTFEINGATKTGYKLVLDGDTLDGVGTAAETGDASEVDYGSANYDDESDTTDSIAYKIALSPLVSYETMQENFKIVVVTEAKQYKNTSDDSWAVVGTDEITF